jgi:hypothetical protein
MTEQEIRAVFDELERIGVDLERPPGLALGTGFRGGEFLTWLRTLPDALGHDLFVDQLTAHVMTAAPLHAPEETAPKASTPASFLECATREQLDAAIDVLVDEWDPLGARLGDLSRADVAQTAFDIVNAILADSDAGSEGRIATAIGQVEEQEFGVRPSPAEQRRYLARRLIGVVIDHPAPNGHQVRAMPDGSSNFVELGPRGDEPPALDAEASCSQCGTTGTVAVVMRDIEPLVSRYCVDCWHSVRDKYWMRTHPTFDTSTPEGTIAAFDYMRSAALDQARYAASALWEDTLDFVLAALKPNDRDTASDHERQLGRLADDLLQQAPLMYGAMPPAIEAFVQQYGRPHA